MRGTDVSRWIFSPAPTSRAGASSPRGVATWRQSTSIRAQQLSIQFAVADQTQRDRLRGRPSAHGSLRHGTGRREAYEISQVRRANERRRTRRRFGAKCRIASMTTCCDGIEHHPFDRIFLRACFWLSTSRTCQDLRPRGPVGGKETAPVRHVKMSLTFRAKGSPHECRSGSDPFLAGRVRMAKRGQDYSGPKYLLIVWPWRRLDNDDFHLTPSG